MIQSCEVIKGVVGAAIILVIVSGCAPRSHENRDRQGVDSVSAFILEEALAALSRADYSAAMGFAEGVEARQPGLVETSYVKGQIYYDLHLYDEAEQHWERVLEAEPEYWLWWQNLGDVAFRKLEFRKAANYYRRAASLDTNPLAWQGLAGAYLELGLADSVAYALERAIEADSMHAPAYLSLSIVAEDAGDLETAYALALRALTLDQTSTENALATGLLAYRLGLYDEAVNLLTQVAQVEPSNHSALYNLAHSLQRTGRSDEAHQVFEAANRARDQDAVISLRRDAVENNPKNPANHLALAEALQQAGRIDEALRAYKTADVMVPADPHIRHTIATIYMEKGEFSDAILRFYDIIQRDSSFVEAWLNLGIAYARQDEMEKARSVWEEAGRRFPGHPGVRQVLERVRIVD